MSLASQVKTLRLSEVAQGPTWTGEVLGSEHRPSLTAEPAPKHHGSSFYNLLLSSQAKAWHWGHGCEQDRHGPHAQGPDGLMWGSWGGGEGGSHDTLGLQWCKHRKQGGGLYREGQPRGGDGHIAV